jgi:hypothetical protein
MQLIDVRTTEVVPKCRQLPSQRFREETMIPVPPSFAVQRNEEEVGAFERVQHFVARGGCFIEEDRIAERTA